MPVMADMSNERLQNLMTEQNKQMPVIIIYVIAIDMLGMVTH